MAKFWDMFASSVIVSSLIAVGCIGTMLYLACTAQPIPDILVNVTMIVIGFFFGGKVQQAQASVVSQVRDAATEARKG